MWVPSGTRHGHKTSKSGCPLLSTTWTFMVARIGLVPAHPTGTSLDLGGGASVFAKWSVVLLVNAAAIKDCCCLMCIQSAWKDDRFLPLHRVFLFKEHKSSDFLNESICGTESPWFPFILYEMEVNLNPLETHLKKLNSSKWMFCLYSLLYCRSSAWQRVKSTYWFKMSSPFMACTCCWMSKCKYKE